VNGKYHRRESLVSAKGVPESAAVPTPAPDSVNSAVASVMDEALTVAPVVGWKRMAIRPA
jgi:hypothetical protein